MREKTKDLISDLILEEIKECHDTRYEIRKIIREEIRTIEEELGLEYSPSWWRGMDKYKNKDIWHFTRLDKLSDMPNQVKKLEHLTNANDYEYVTETKLVLKKKDKK